MKRVMLGDLGSPLVLHEIELVLMEEECQPFHYIIKENMLRYVIHFVVGVRRNHSNFQSTSCQTYLMMDS